MCLKGYYSPVYYKHLDVQLTLFLEIYFVWAQQDVFIIL